MGTTKDFIRFVSLAALLIAGSCAAPTNDGSGLMADGIANHPITVEPSYRAIKLPFSATDAGLMPDDAAHFSVFVSEYLNSGNGAISITAPQGAGANAAIGYFGERLASLGVPRDRILVGTRARMPATDVLKSATWPTPRMSRPAARTGRKTGVILPTTSRHPISAARCSTIWPQWWPIRATWSSRGKWMRRMPRGVPPPSPVTMRRVRLRRPTSVRPTSRPSSPRHKFLCPVIGI